jgi:hypothetical protein
MFVKYPHRFIPGALVSYVSGNLNLLCDDRRPAVIVW